MLDKDQYNQEEYNDYYQQEIRGAETSGGVEDDDDSGKKSGILIFLGLALLGVAGYFGYKTLNQSDSNPNTDESIVVQKESIKKSETATKLENISSTKEEVASVNEPKDSIKEDNKEVQSVTNSVKTAMGNEQKMSPEEIAKVVQMVMSQMNNHKVEKVENITKDKELKVEEEDKNLKEDTNLISTLSGSDVDLVEDEDEDKKLEESLTNIVETTKDTNINTNIDNDSVEVDTYNKVKVEENSGEDELSRLSSQISSLISDKKSSDQTETSIEENIYTESLKKEVVTRKNEMRIIVVRKGDTLGKIAQRAYGNVMEYRKIYKANPDILKRPDRIYIGQKLRIPK